MERLAFFCLDIVFYLVVIVEIVKFLVAAVLHGTHVTVHIHAFAGHFNDTARNVGAMVGNTFQIVDDVRMNETEFDGTDTLLQTGNVLLLELFTQ